MKKKVIYNKFKYKLEKLIILNINNTKFFNNINNFFFLINKKFKYNIKLLKKTNLKLKTNYFKFILKKNL